jgi:ABC-type sugar transport system substrate-binding protein
MKTKLFALSVILIVAMLLGACQPKATPEGEKEPYLVGYMAPNDAQGQIMFMKSFEEYATKAGMEVVEVNADSDAAKQDTQCSDLIAQGVDALVMVPVDSQAISTCVDRASTAGIPVFGIDRQPFNAKVIMTIGSDNYLAGKQGALCLVERLKAKYGEEKGNVLEVTGDLGTNVAQLRGSGFNDEMKLHPNIKVTTLPTDWSPEMGASLVQNAFAADPTIDGIYWHSDYTGAGIIPALGEIGKLFKVGEEGHIFICGIDGDPQSLKNMKEGYQDATVNQPMTDFGVLAEFVKKYLDGETLTAGTYTKAGAPWSPSSITTSQYGLNLNMGTWLITAADADDPTLWGNWKPAE